jgi:O-antigen ligase
MWTRRHLLLSAILLGNAIAFAGVDPITRLVTAVLVLAMMADLARRPRIPRLHLWATVSLGALALVQLIPLPQPLRGLLQPGFAEVLAVGWAPLSLAPWATVQVAASAVVFAGIALAGAKMSATRTGLPALITLIAVTGLLVALLGLAGEAGAPEKVMLVRPNTGGGGVYGPFVNSNHFALAIELTLPATIVLLMFGIRRSTRPGASRQQSVVLGLAAVIACAVGCAALLRSGSRGGVLFLVVALMATLSLWWRSRSAQRTRRWPWIPVVAVVVLLTLMLASTRLAVVRDEFSHLLVVEGVEGNTRWDLWRGTWRSWQRSPLVGSGLGSYRFVIGMDKPATGAHVLEQAHNDWLEWFAAGGVLGGVTLGLGVVGLAALLRPRLVRRLRFDFRYPLAGAALAFAAVALHETIGFGLQIPLNRYLLATWLGIVWGITQSHAGSMTEEADDER